MEYYSKIQKIGMNVLKFVKSEKMMNEGIL